MDTYAKEQNLKSRDVKSIGLVKMGRKKITRNASLGEKSKYVIYLSSHLTHPPCNSIDASAISDITK